MHIPSSPSSLDTCNACNSHGTPVADWIFGSVVAWTKPEFLFGDSGSDGLMLDAEVAEVWLHRYADAFAMGMPAVTVEFVTAAKAAGNERPMRWMRWKMMDKTCRFRVSGSEIAGNVGQDHFV